MGDNIVLLQIEREIRKIKRNLYTDGTIDFDPAVFTLFFSGHKEEAFRAMCNPTTVDFRTIQDSLRKALLLFHNGEMPENWVAEWDNLLKAVALRRNRPNLRLIRTAD